GKVDEIDERSDVFGLGAVLCEILTGKPPYAAVEKEECLRQAVEADLTDALARLRQCGADKELIGLATRCLAKEQDKRWQDAGEVAEAVDLYYAKVQRRIKRWRNITTVFAAGLFLVVSFGAVAIWYIADRAKREGEKANLKA